MIGTWLGIALRGIWWRRGVTAAIFAVAVVAGAAATVGPVYFQAAGTSILQDGLHTAPAIGQVVDLFREGRLGDSQLTAIRQGMTGVLDRSPAAARFGQPVQALEFPGRLPGGGHDMTVLAWRDGACGQLHLTAGRCPTGAGEVIASAGLADRLGWRLGQRLTDGLTDPRNQPVPLTITGFYRPLDPYAAYWADRPYFAVLGGQNQSDRGPSYTDGLFTARATFAALAPSVTGDNVVDLPLRSDQLRFTDVAAVDALVTDLSTQVPETQAQSTMNAVLASASSSRQALAVPVFLVTAQLLVLCWLLLFLLVNDAAEARGPEVALAKLRGLTRTRTVLFGLSEQVVLLVVALPVGAIAGWLATRALAAAVLRPGTPVPLVGLGWAAAAVAVAGGGVAAAIAARRTIARPVLAQWRRAAARPAGRGWVVDAVVGTLAVAALVELFLSGTLGSATQNALALLVPGLLALAVALLSSRVLPVLCRLAFRRTGRRGGIGSFLAVRQVARRPGGAHTTIALTVAFGLVTFTIAAWSVATGNIHDVAWTEVGAARVLTVAPPTDTELADIVDRLDPSGRNAVAVERLANTDPDSSQTRSLLAVDPARFARVAYWRGDFATASLAALAGRLTPAAPPPVTLRGDQLSVTLDTRIAGGGPAAEVYAEVTAFDTTGPTPVDLGSVGPTGTATRTAALPDCDRHPCVLRQLYLQPLAQTGADPYGLFGGSVTFSAIGTHDTTGWHRIDAGLTDPGRWQAPAGSYDRLRVGPGGLALRFAEQNGAVINSVNAPTPLPAIVTGSVLGTGGSSPLRTYGLDDGLTLDITPVGVASALPGAGADGVLVDRNYAELASTGVAGDVDQQVWLAPSAPAGFVDELRSAGVTILSTQDAATVRNQLSQQGPALALVLFLADAAAAAVLAAGGAVLSLHLAGRRRGYELTALVATGATRRSLRGGLLAEQGLTLGFGVLLGIGAGLLATVLAVPSVPEFVAPPSGTAPLHYLPSATALTGLLAAAIALLAMAAVTSSLALVNGIRPERLREATP